MKKTIIALVLAVCLIAAIAIAVVMVANAGSVSVEDARAQYESFRNDMKNMSSEQAMLSAADLFSKIADGKRTQKAEFAALVREFTHDTITFNDDETFSVAKEMSDIYSSVANGTKTFGLQDITVSRTDSVMRIAIDQLGIQYYNTCTVQNPDEEIIPRGDKRVTYDGSLGKNLIKITLWDCALSNELAQKYSSYTAYTPVDADGNENTDVKIMFAEVSHSTTIYIGSDNPISVSEQTQVKINRPSERIIVDAAR